MSKVKEIPAANQRPNDPPFTVTVTTAETTIIAETPPPALVAARTKGKTDADQA